MVLAQCASSSLSGNGRNSDVDKCHKREGKKKKHVLVYYLWLKVNSRTIKSDVCICECINAYIGCMCGHTHKHRNMFHFRGF